MLSVKLEIVKTQIVDCLGAHQTCKIACIIFGSTIIGPYNKLSTYNKHDKYRCKELFPPKIYKCVLHRNASTGKSMLGIIRQNDKIVVYVLNVDFNKKYILNKYKHA